MILTCCVCVAACAVVSAQADWRNSIGQIRALAENDAARAYQQAQQLQTTLPADATPADRARVLNLLARLEVYLALTEQAADHAQLALQLATQHADRIGQAEANLTIALNAVNQGRIDLLTAATTASMTALEGVDQPDLLGESLLRTAMMYRRVGEFTRSVTMCMQAMDIARRSNNPVALAYAYQGLAISYDLSGRYAEARDNYQQMRDQARIAGSKLLEGYALSGMGTAYTSLGDMRQGEALLRQAITLYREVGAPFAASFGVFQLQDRLRREARYAEALSLLNEVLRVYEEHPNKIGVWYTLNARSETYESLGNMPSARADAERAYTLAAEIGFPLYQGNSARRIAALAAVAGDHRRAYALSIEANQMSAKMISENSGERMVELAREYQTESRQRAIDELTRRNEKQTAELRQHELQQRWLLTVLIGSVLALICTGLFLLHLRKTQADLTASNQRLRDEVAERSRAEQEVQRLNTELEARVVQRTADLTATNRELEAFSYSLSHDLRSPLRIIDAFTSILRDSYGSKLDREGLDHLQHIRASVKRMTLLIEDMLKLFRMSRQEVHVTSVNFSELAQEVVTELGHADPERKVEAVIGSRLIAVGDASLLRIALENLLGNAWKFTRDTHKPHIEVGCLHSKDHQVYFVRDNGAGFDMSHAKKLFTPFQRMHSDKQFEGTGIGLAIVQRVIERHGGRVWVDSHINEGTTVYFELQTDQEAAKLPTEQCA